MNLYSKNKDYKLYNGSMLDMREVIESNSIDAIVTDPPYELGFMGKDWDNSGIAFQTETWKKCLEVLKPGGYLLAFGGSRTFHRIACAIEDAGFEIRDTVMWLYGCLSEDSEVLTESGFKRYNDVQVGEKIRIYDIENGIYKWETPERWNIYEVNNDTCYRIRSNCTDQLVSRNHRCLVEREGSLVFEFAENLAEMERVPVLSYDIPVIQKGSSKILFTDLLWQDENMVKELFSEWEREEEPEQISLWREKPIMERWSDLSEEERELFRAENKICQMPEEVFINGEGGWLCDGTSVDCCKGSGETTIENGGCSSYKSQCGGQQTGESDAICKQSRSQEFRVWETYYTTLATVSEEKYSGMIFCPTVSTGCFVARRNGKVFITGNSGFPKSMNIGLSIDKKNGIEVISDYVPNNKNGVYDRNMGGRKSTKTQKAQNKWDGWGTALKPSYEPIIVARKPCEGSCVANILKYGVGGINVDECRVFTKDVMKHGGCLSKMNGDDRFGKALGMFQEGTKNTFEQNPGGRFPANMILTYDENDFEEVCGGLPSGGKNGNITKRYKMNNQVYGEYGECNTWQAYDDSGSAARYFYCAKASKRDRDEGLENLVEKYRGMSNQAKAELSRDNVGFDGGSANTIGLNRVIARKNIHPTVKPTDLMQYLVRLVTPEGGTVLDPFNGSGSTGKAVMYENMDRNKGYKYIGIELSEEYLEISKARIEYVCGEDHENEIVGEHQISIFELLEGEK